MLGIPSNLYGTGYGAGFSASRADSTLGAALTAPLGSGTPVNTAAGVLSGSTSIGSTLTATVGTWVSTTAMTFQFQFQGDGANLGSPQTSPAYVTQAGDAGKVIRFYVIATNANGSRNGTLSNGITTDAAPVNTVAGVLSGSTTYGATMSMTTGTWVGAPTITYQYQMRLDGVDSGSPQSGATYVTDITMIGKVLTFKPIGTNGIATVTGLESNGITIAASSTPLAGYRIWYDVSQIVGKVDGDLISSLADHGTAGADLSASGTGRPTYRASALNSKAGLEFNGTSNFMTWAGFSFDTAAATVFIVIKNVPAPALASYAMEWGTGGSAGNNVRYMNSYTNAGVSKIFCGVGAGAAIGVVITPGENIIAAMVFNGASSSIQLNGDGARITSGSINTALASNGFFTFGEDPLSAGHWAAYTLCEVLTYSSALSSGDRAYNVAYLKAKYGL